MDTANINITTSIDRKKIIYTLQSGNIEILGQPLAGSNSTLFVSSTWKENQVFAIYKPEKGAQPLWDFPLNTLTKRELAAYLISLLLDWNFVPPTVLRNQNAPYGKGSLQLFIAHNPQINYFNLPIRDELKLQKIALFDIVINNADRKAGHLLYDENGNIWLIDHGLCFHTDFKLRTVIWEFANMPIPDILISDLNKLVEILKTSKLKIANKMRDVLSTAEIYMVISRIERLIESGVFPQPDQNRRPYPWPLI